MKREMEIKEVSPEKAKERFAWAAARSDIPTNGTTVQNNDRSLGDDDDKRAFDTSHVPEDRKEDREEIHKPLYRPQPIDLRTNEQREDSKIGISGITRSSTFGGIGTDNMNLNIVKGLSNHVGKTESGNNANISSNGNEMGSEEGETFTEDDADSIGSVELQAGKFVLPLLPYFPTSASSRTALYIK